MEDREFIRREKVPMTKEEVRSISLSYLELYRAKSFLDVGAGSGSVVLEALITFPELEATVVEMKKDALETIRENIVHLEVSKGISIADRLEIIEGKAPVVLEKTFDAVFVGGTAGDVGDIIRWTKKLLNDGGVMVMNFVTVENYYEAMKLLKQDEELTAFRGIQLAVNRLTPLAKYTILKPENPIWILCVKKGA
ncbi:precorrin-6Y C5,15-methyltransferase (decarboxylating) subunit CbiT [Filifactor villosus]|uniref:Precorrin-6Y C5,15-methyltransferase (Decarboxylating) subunit CbiT n=1 Tax=Filifactor villosus TaxID=29374 RepID=A0ABV9QKN0_9FIRM